MRTRFLALAGLCAGSGVLVSVLVSCFADPREGDSVTVVDKCDTAALSTDPTNPHSSLLAYVQATDSLLTRTTAVEAELRDVCNAIDTDLGIPTGTDAIGACKGLSARIEGVIKKEPPPPLGSTSSTDWVELRFPPSCQTPPGTLEGCLSKCSGPCDTSKCAPGKVAGKCNGTCLGTCSETGDAVPCQGKCVGETGLDGGSCQGECTGVCGGQAWAGDCTGSCSAGFTGTCTGTCTGACNGVPIGDAGAPSDGGAEAEAGDPDAGVPEAGPPASQFKKPPGGADGNCNGLCVGLCSSGANGDCKAPCLTFAEAGAPIGKFTNGFCGASGTPAVCTGSCRSATGTGSTGSCSGTCTQTNIATCNGICRVADGGGCNGTLENPVCEGTETCNQNAECNNACSALAALAAVCAEPKVIQLYAVSDPALADALVKHGGALGKVVNELAQLRNAFGFIGNRAYGDFSAIGLTGDLVRACVNQGTTSVKAANAKLTSAVTANPTTRKFQ
jgi:hypothetical protein